MQPYEEEGFDVYFPYGSVASLYLWAVAGGAVEGMRDYAPAKKKAQGAGHRSGTSGKSS